MSTSKFVASMIGIAILTMSILVGLALVSRPEFPGPLFWCFMTPGAFLIGLLVTVAIDNPINRGLNTHS